MGVQAKKTSALYDIRRTTKLMEEQYIYVAQNKVPEKRSLRARLLRTFDRWTGGVFRVRHWAVGEKRRLRST
jgi:hypothetical protein